ncbi:hypothetical protein O0L34_g4960 [Tuta absoluta]|nr:hypothetical protein O0L34_g4960 [Tuta absoluta]
MYCVSIISEYCGVFLSYLIYRIVNTLLCDNNFIATRFRARRHTWRSIQCNKSIPYNIYCSVCGKLMLPVVGLFCECCAASACRGCHKVVNKTLRCKSVSWSPDKVFPHHWVNVGSTQGDTAGHGEGEEAIKRFFCSWCQRTKMSSDTALNLNEACDFHKYRKIIIPPYCVLTEKGQVMQIKPLPDEDWEPLFIFANRKSGSNRNDEVLSIFRGLLNPIQVIDMSQTAPESVVRWLPARCRILAAGGDGTVAWLLNSLITVPHVKAAVGILPMGTGNDMSRVLGWGAGCESLLDAQAIIEDITRAAEQPIDRWKITISPRRGRLRRGVTERVLYAYNYTSIGVDAQVALDFHHARRQFLFRYANRTLNYLAYVCLGASRALDAGRCDNLERKLHVRLDGGAPMPLPPLQALVALNINSWGAGVDLWSMGDEEEVGPQSISDGKLEIVGISSSFHIARLQCGLAEPYRFAQASRVKIELDGSCAMQVDGEPWMQSPATIVIEPAGQALVLKATHNE